MTIQVTIRTVYGKDLIYPVDDKARLFVSLVGQKTLTPKHLELIKALGFEVELLNAYSLTKEGN
jgi:hypothetical protein